MKMIDLTGVRQMSLILEYSSGVLYRNHVGPGRVNRVEAEGVLAPLAISHEHLLQLANELPAFAAAQMSDALAEQLEDTFLSMPSTMMFKVDRDQRHSSQYAWINLRIETFDNEAVADFRGAYFGFGCVRATLTW